ncbi:amidohydrolase family protein [Celeribacter sp.]|uniref:amidohydrolase family protein n=1 Tax=Celeribacter sp. TaxID=1890673 RepID=UPI003A931E4F
MLPPIIDSHVHWRDPINPYEALSDTVDENGNRGGAEVQPYLPEDYRADAADVDVVGVVHIEAEWSKADPVGETRWLHGLATGRKTTGLPLVVMGFCDLSKPVSEVEGILDAHAAMPLTRGIRHILNRVEGNPALCWADREYLDDETWRAGYGLLGKYGLDFDLMCFGHQLEPFAKLAALHPDIPVHLEHAALPWDHSDEGREVWRKGMKALAALPHADVKISGLGNTVPNWTTQSIRDYVLEAIDIFGTDRVSFASNFPTDKQFSDMSTIWRAFDEITASFTWNERKALFAGNAHRLYRFSK